MPEVKLQVEYNLEADPKQYAREAEELEKSLGHAPTDDDLFTQALNPSAVLNLDFPVNDPPVFTKKHGPRLLRGAHIALLASEILEAAQPEERVTSGRSERSIAEGSDVDETEKPEPNTPLKILLHFVEVTAAKADRLRKQQGAGESLFDELYVQLKKFAKKVSKEIRDEAEIQSQLGDNGEDRPTA